MDRKPLSAVFCEQERAYFLWGANLKFFVIAYKKSSIICQRENYILTKASVKILSAAKTANISGVKYELYRCAKYRAAKNFRICIFRYDVLAVKLSRRTAADFSPGISTNKFADILQNNSMFPNEQILFKECK